MIETLMNLDRIEVGYTVFEKDQVLTPEQLNGLSGYLDDQVRLTRVGLVGVGIACGLWPSLAAGGVRLTHGVGTTTDGDLVLLSEATVYDRYKPYDASAPKYPPFYRGAAMLPVFELVPAGKDDERALPLARFGEEEDRTLDAMVALLYVESHLHDPDLCTGTDCDNRGMNVMHTTRLLLVDARSAAFLSSALDTPDRAARTPLDPVVADRPALQGALASEADLAIVYRKACAAIHAQLIAAFSAFYAPCKSLLEDLVPADPAPRWRKTLEQIRDGVKDRGIQYYYDFLKDLVETYNAFRDALFGDTTLCCPDFAAFPKHLVLGALDPRLRAGERTGFHPSPAVSATYGQREHARFLIRKLDTLIGSFALPVEAAEIRITPSAFEDRDLEQRAIPFYYALRDNVVPVHLAWSHTLSQKGMERYAYSYHAERYGALGGARRPHAAQIGAFDFFRIEGHLGWKVREAAKTLRDLVRAQNLPIDVETVLLGKNRGKAVFDPPWRHFDLYRLRHLARAEVAAQLDEAGKYGGTLAGRVGKAVDDKVIQNADVGEGVEVKGLAANKGTELLAQTQKLALMLEQDTAQESFQKEAAKAMGMAADFNLALSPVFKKEYVSPLDSLIDARPLHWLTWLDAIIKDADEKEAERMLLAAYLQQHPGLEHYAGVLRGGTFVLVHDENDMVVADFMLPYNCCERRGQVPQPPPLVPLPKPPLVFDGPIRILPFPDKFRFFQWRDDFMKNVVEKDLEQYKNYFNVYKEIVLTAGTSKAGGAALPGTTLPQTGGTVVLPSGEIRVLTDRTLAMHVADTQWKERRVQVIRTTLLDPELESGKRAVLETELKTAEAELGTAILTATQYVATTNLDVKTGSEGAVVMEVASAGLGKVTDLDTLAKVEKGLTTLGQKPGTSTDMSNMIGNVLSGRGLM